jgi:hypothetical protein
MTPAMVETPRARLVRRSRYGRWSAFTVDPGLYYKSFRRHVEVDDRVSKYKSFAAVGWVEERLRSRPAFAAPGAATCAVPSVPHCRIGAVRSDRRLPRQRRTAAPGRLAYLLGARMATEGDPSRGLLRGLVRPRRVRGLLVRVPGGDPPMAAGARWSSGADRRITREPGVRVPGSTLSANRPLLSRRRWPTSPLSSSACQSSPPTWQERPSESCGPCSRASPSRSPTSRRKRR